MKEVKYKHQTSTDSSIIIIMCPKDVSKSERSSKPQDSRVVYGCKNSSQSVKIILCLANLSRKTIGRQIPNNRFKSLKGEGFSFD